MPLHFSKMIPPWLRRNNHFINLKGNQFQRNRLFFCLLHKNSTMDPPPPLFRKKVVLKAQHFVRTSLFTCFLLNHFLIVFLLACLMRSLLSAFVLSLGNKHSCWSCKNHSNFENFISCFLNLLGFQKVTNELSKIC